MKEKKRKKKGTREAQITQKTNPSSEGMSGPKCHPQGPRLLGFTATLLVSDPPACELRP